jgi:hypothetical protein
MKTATLSLPGLVVVVVVVVAVWVPEIFGLFIMRGINTYTKLTSNHLLPKTFPH